MTMNRETIGRELFILGLCLLLALAVAPALAQSIDALPPATETTQYTIEGNPACPEGMISFQPHSNDLDDTGGGTFSDGHLIANVVVTGFNVAWTSNHAVDLFLVHGSDSANVYAYVPGAVSGSSSTPPNLNGQGQANLSHYQFCYDYQLRLDTTVSGTYIRTYTWDISKDYDSTYTGFIGDPAFTHDYLVTVDQTVTDTVFVVSGVITVYNDTPVQALNVSVGALLNAGGVDDSVTVGCPASTVAAMRDGIAGNMVCTYTHNATSAADGASTATVTASNLSSGSETVDVIFGPPTTVGYPIVNVTDNEAGELGSASGDVTFPYSRSLQCPTDKLVYTFGVYAMPALVNTASIIEIPGEVDSTAVNLTCYAPVVSNIAAGIYDERYLWDIANMVTPPSLSGFGGDSLPWSWTVNVGEAFVNAQFAISGTIVFQYPLGALGIASLDVSEALANALDDRTVASADCDPSLPGNQTTLTLSPGTAGTCSYTALPTNVTATLQSGFASEALYYDWQLIWTKSGPAQEGFELHGEITVTNPSPVDMTVLLGNTVTDGTPLAIEPSAACDYDSASGELTVPASSTASCRSAGAPADASSEVYTATATLNDMVFSSMVSMVFTLDQVFNESATISNPSLGFSQLVTASGLQSFTEYHICPTDQANYTGGVDNSFVDINTATLTGSDGFSREATAHHAVTCYAPLVTTNAETSWSRDWTWEIDKASSETAVGPILPNQPFLVDWSVTARAFKIDSNFQVWGTIWISNPNPSANMVLVGVADMVSPGIRAEVLCPTLAVPAGGSISCTYRAPLPDASSYSNTAAVGINYGNVAWFSNVPATPVLFSAVPTAEIDECSTVSDTPFGPLFNGLQICATAGGSNTFTETYSVDVGRDPCGPYTYHNEASFETNDNHEAGSANWDVNVEIACSSTCTLTPSYWKTHSIYGPSAHPDDTWASVGGPDAPFFLSGQTWYQVFWTSPDGSEYYDLAHQYMAARLNTLQQTPNGVVPPPEAVQALEDAQAFFSGYTPAESTTLPDEARNAAQHNASVLAQFNSGLLSAPPCDEDTTSRQ